MADRIFLQMDQATLANQIILRNLRECLKDSNLDRHLSLYARGHYQKTALWHTLYSIRIELYFPILELEGHI